MTVKDLIELLQDYDEDAQVLIMMQQSRPFECYIKGVASNEEVTGEERRLAQELHGDDFEEEQSFSFDGKMLPANRVFIVEGNQAKYGNKEAWEAARR